MSRAGTNEEEKSGRNRLTVWTLSGMTDLGHFRLSPDAIGGAYLATVWPTAVARLGEAVATSG